MNLKTIYVFLRGKLAGSSIRCLMNFDSAYIIYGWTCEKSVSTAYPPPVHGKLDPSDKYCFFRRVFRVRSTTAWAGRVSGLGEDVRLKYVYRWTVGIPLPSWAGNKWKFYTKRAWHESTSLKRRTRLQIILFLFQYSKNTIFNVKIKNKTYFFSISGFAILNGLRRHSINVYWCSNV